MHMLKPRPRTGKEAHRERDAYSPEARD